MLKKWSHHQHFLLWKKPWATDLKVLQLYCKYNMYMYFCLRGNSILRKEEGGGITIYICIKINGTSLRLVLHGNKEMIEFHYFTYVWLGLIWFQWWKRMINKKKWGLYLNEYYYFINYHVLKSRKWLEQKPDLSQQRLLLKLSSYKTM